MTYCVYEPTPKKRVTLAAKFHAFMDALAERRKQSRNAEQLKGLSDRQLNDIGLKRDYRFPTLSQTTGLAYLR